MSKGPGRIDRIISDAFAADPDSAFTTDDICERAFPDAPAIEKKHRVSVVRAIKRACERDPGYSLRWSCRAGATLIISNAYSVTSLAIAALMQSGYPRYRPSANTVNQMSADDWRAWAREALAEGGKHHGKVVPGGLLDKLAKLHRARRDGHVAVVESLEREFAGKLASARAALTAIVKR